MIPQACARPARVAIALSIVALLLWYCKPITKYNHKASQKSSSSVKNHHGKDQVCQVQNIDPFNREMMQLLTHDGEHKCTPENRVKMHIKDNVLSITGTEVTSVRSRQITDSGVGFSYLDYVQRFGDAPAPTSLKDKRVGVLQNSESKACLVPQITDGEKVADEIPVVFGNDCDHLHAEFNFTTDGYIIHKNTRKCFRPKSGPKSLRIEQKNSTLSEEEAEPQHDELVLSDICDSIFDVILGGVLRLSGTKFCLHPLFKTPNNDEKVWFYAECSTESRLTYLWYPGSKKKAGKITSKVTFPLVTDMTHAQIELSGDDEVIDIHVLSCLPKLLPVTEQASSVKPNIVVLCIEELSAAHFHRELGSVASVMEEMGFLQYQKHSAVSEMNLLNLVTVLNGISGMEEKPGVDSPIFKTAALSNYVSMVTADDPTRVDAMKRGLEEAHHNSLPFFRYLKDEYKLHDHNFCVNGQPIHKLSFDYLHSFLRGYPNRSKLALMVFSQLSRSSLQNLGRHGYLRKYLSEFLEYLKGMKNTIVFVHSLMGGITPRVQDLAQSLHEVKRPFLATYASKDIQDFYNFEVVRSAQLSTPFDIHVTLRHIMTSDDSHGYGKSLLKRTEPRKCRESAVYPPMCPCL